MDTILGDCPCFHVDAKASVPLTTHTSDHVHWADKLVTGMSLEGIHAGGTLEAKV